MKEPFAGKGAEREEKPKVRYEDVVPKRIETEFLGVESAQWSERGIVRRIQGWKEEYNLDLDPPFQRGHVWTEEQQVAYVEFMVSGGMGSNEIYFNDPNFHGSDDEKPEDTRVIVDGKQRLTAALRYLQGEIPAFGRYADEYEGSPQCEFILRVNNLKTDAEVYQWYLELNTTGTPHTEEELDKVQKMLEEEKEKNAE